MLVEFSYHPQIHDWLWIYFYLKEENARDIKFGTNKSWLFLRLFLLYIKGRNAVYFFLFPRTSIGFHKRLKIQYSSGGFSKTHPSQWGRIFCPPQPHPMFRASPHRGKDFPAVIPPQPHRGSTFLPVWPRWVIKLLACDVRMIDSCKID